MRLRKGAVAGRGDIPSQPPTAAGRQVMTPEALARLFHEAYERLAPDYGYRTREASAVPWGQVPEANRRLMVATAEAVLEAMGRAGMLR